MRVQPDHRVHPPCFLPSFCEMSRTGIPRPLDIAKLLRNPRKAPPPRKLTIPLLSPARHGPPPAPRVEQESRTPPITLSAPRRNPARADLPVLPIPEAKRAKASGCLARDISLDKTLLSEAVGELTDKFYAASNQRSVAAKRRLLQELATNVASHAGRHPFPLVQSTVQGVAATLMKAGYRSAEGYLN